MNFDLTQRMHRGLLSAHSNFTCTEDGFTYMMSLLSSISYYRGIPVYEVVTEMRSGVSNLCLDRGPLILADYTHDDVKTLFSSLLGSNRIGSDIVLKNSMDLASSQIILATLAASFVSIQINWYLPESSAPSHIFRPLNSLILPFDFYVKVFELMKFKRPTSISVSDVAAFETIFPNLSSYFSLPLICLVEACLEFLHRKLGPDKSRSALLNLPDVLVSQKVF